MITPPRLPPLSSLRLGAPLFAVCSFIFVTSASAEVSCTDFLEPNTLPTAGTEAADLDVTDGKTYCVQEPGDYYFRHINIRNGARLHFQDANIQFWASSILVENDGHLEAGTPENPIGTEGRLEIYLYGADQGPGGAGVRCKTDDICGIPQDIWDSNGERLVTIPGLQDPHRFYQYDNLMFDKADPKAYFGYKVIGVSYGGALKFFGKKGATYGEVANSDSGSSWRRLDGTLLPDGRTLRLDRAVDWSGGDQIVVTTTDYLPDHSEQLTIDYVEDDGRTIHVVEPFQYIHNGQAYDLTGLPDRLGIKQRKPQAETRAAVALLSRSIRILSAGERVGETFPSAQPEDWVPSTEEPGTEHPYYFGGHVVVRQGVKAFQMQGVELYQMGQGGRMGHYPIHFHLTRETPPDTFVKDSSIHDSMTRWITLHGTHDVTLARNVGFKSIGHGYYIEDGTEINNRFYSNIGIFARAAIDNDDNPRKVPGIIAWTGNLEVNNDAIHHSDYRYPAVFWMTNTWNDFQYNMAVGAGACGVCFWPIPAVAGPTSAAQQWTSYASLQLRSDHAGTTPIKSFKGNFCSTAMHSYIGTADLSQCNGVGRSEPNDPRLEPIVNPLAPAPSRAWFEDSYYPRVTGNRYATRCDAESKGAVAVADGIDCSQVSRCAQGQLEGCMVTVLDDYTSSFNWAETNFSAIWMRPLWSLVVDSFISDVQSAGLTFVTGGDYTKSSSPDGNWLLALRTVFVGQSQGAVDIRGVSVENPLSADLGPFNGMQVDLGNGKTVSGLQCDNNRTDYCASVDHGIAMPLSNFANNQRLFNLYDGPAQQESNAYLDIRTRAIDDCKHSSGNCNNSADMYGRVLGMPYDSSTDTCYLPNAAIAWKQPNGFYYPPSFHSDNLYFEDVDIRHFVIDPLFTPGTRSTDFTAATSRYCTRNPTMFDNFTSVDRQTVLNDDDGSLTGLAQTISVNEDPFFNAPVETIECLSDATAKTSPYSYVTTVVYPKCASAGEPSPQTCGSAENGPGAWWSKGCTDPNCYGVPLYRQLLTAEEFETDDTPSIRLMGQASWQRSNLTPNHGRFYLDTTTTENKQRQSGTQNVNTFVSGETYYVFLIYATEQSAQTYDVYVGRNFDEASVAAIQAELNTVNFSIRETAWPSAWSDPSYDSDTGILTVTMDMGFADFRNGQDEARVQSCGPQSFCTWQSGSGCRCADELQRADPDLYQKCIQNEHAICSWSGIDVDCPSGGCFGFSFTMPDDFSAQIAALSDPNQVRPPAECFPNTPDWDVAWTHADPDLAGECFNPVLGLVRFCDGSAKAPLQSRPIIMGTEEADVLIGSFLDDIILGEGGNDLIFGSTGNDWLSGGAGDDILRGDGGDDTLYGDEGDDILIGSGGEDVADGGAGADRCFSETLHDCESRE